MRVHLVPQALDAWSFLACVFSDDWCSLALRQMLPRMTAARRIRPPLGARATICQAKPRPLLQCQLNRLERREMLSGNNYFVGVGDSLFIATHPPFLGPSRSPHSRFPSRRNIMRLVYNRRERP
jgi:hypothetical protein